MPGIHQAAGRRRSTGPVVAAVVAALTGGLAAAGLADSAAAAPAPGSATQVAAATAAIDTLRDTSVEVSRVGAARTPTISSAFPDRRNHFASGDDVQSNFAYGVIRLGKTIYLHTNAAHGSLNITGLLVNSKGNLVIQRSVLPGEVVVSCSLVPDETVARLDVQVGCSGGLSQTQVWLYRNGKRLSPSDPIFGADRANIWVTITGLAPAG